MFGLAVSGEHDRSCRTWMDISNGKWTREPVKSSIADVKIVE
jgi:hypothetical protein